MGLRRALPLLPCALALGRAQDGGIAAPRYTAAQCARWVDGLRGADGDGSAGLSEEEYYAFLSGIEEPPYVAAYFADYAGFEELPWAFRVVHKSLACHCEKLGRGRKCCEGEDAEVILPGGLPGAAEGTTLRNAPAAEVDEEYRDLFCQQIAFVLARAIDSPSPTAAPAGTTLTTAAPVATAPVAAPTASPVAPRPTARPTDPEVLVGVVAPEGGDDDGDEGGKGWIIGVIVGVVALVGLLLAAVAAQRRRAEMEEETAVETRELVAGEPDPEVAAAVPAAGGVAGEPDPEVAAAGPATVGGAPYVAGALGTQDDDDDDSAAPSVWSEGEDEGGAAKDGDAGELLPGDNDGGNGSPVAGSALAALGAASTVAVQLQDVPLQDGGGAGGPGRPEEEEDGVAAGEIA